MHLLYQHCFFASVWRRPRLSPGGITSNWRDKPGAVRGLGRGCSVETWYPQHAAQKQHRSPAKETGSSCYEATPTVLTLAMSRVTGRYKHNYIDHETGNVMDMCLTCVPSDMVIVVQFSPFSIVDCSSGNHRTHVKVELTLSGCLLNLKAESAGAGVLEAGELHSWAVWGFGDGLSTAQTVAACPADRTFELAVVSHRYHLNNFVSVVNLVMKYKYTSS
ncbi:hypothetical protein FA15DRAFT_658452 [Coprinopsis marcescibilis]|uniref:Uncharacterized protein n=1 Tax=Coprinopsis marcescibilis TaxID=230819 RepID=A0A5C3KLU1_COPMA|nr:hypothetical protein FA15DRAFT_658452 [Coprinopsis marcescibilis]